MWSWEHGNRIPARRAMKRTEKRGVKKKKGRHVVKKCTKAFSLIRTNLFVLLFAEAAHELCWANRQTQ